MGICQHGSDASLLEKITFLISISHCFSSAIGPTMRFVLFLLSGEGRLTIRESADIVFPRPICCRISKSGAYRAEKVCLSPDPKA